MTRYEKGFLTKCAEAGISQEQAAKLLKQSSTTWHTVAGGGVLGGVIGALQKAENRKDRARKALLGALIGAAGGYGAGRVGELVENVTNDPPGSKFNPIRVDTTLGWRNSWDRPTGGHFPSELELHLSGPSSKGSEYGSRPIYVHPTEGTHITSLGRPIGPND